MSNCNDCPNQIDGTCCHQSIRPINAAMPVIFMDVHLLKLYRDWDAHQKIEAYTYEVER